MADIHFTFASTEQRALFWQTLGREDPRTSPTPADMGAFIDTANPQSDKSVEALFARAARFLWEIRQGTPSAPGIGSAIAAEPPVPTEIPSRAGDFSEISIDWFKSLKNDDPRVFYLGHVKCVLLRKKDQPVGEWKSIAILTTGALLNPIRRNQLSLYIPGIDPASAHFHDWLLKELVKGHQNLKYPLHKFRRLASGLSYTPRPAGAYSTDGGPVIDGWQIKVSARPQKDAPMRELVFDLVDLRAWHKKERVAIGGAFEIPRPQTKEDAQPILTLEGDGSFLVGGKKYRYFDIDEEHIALVTELSSRDGGRVGATGRSPLLGITILGSQDSEWIEKIRDTQSMVRPRYAKALRGGEQAHHVREEKLTGHPESFDRLRTSSVEGSPGAQRIPVFPHPDNPNLARSWLFHPIEGNQVKIGDETLEILPHEEGFVLHAVSEKTAELLLKIPIATTPETVSTYPVFTTNWFNNLPEDYPGRFTIDGKPYVFMESEPEGRIFVITENRAGQLGFFIFHTDEGTEHRIFLVETFRNTQQPGESRHIVNEEPIDPLKPVMKDGKKVRAPYEMETGGEVITIVLPGMPQVVAGVPNSGLVTALYPFPLRKPLKIPAMEVRVKGSCLTYRDKTNQLAPPKTFSFHLPPIAPTAFPEPTVTPTYPLYTPDWFDALPDSHPGVFFVGDKKYVFLEASHNAIMLLTQNENGDLVTAPFSPTRDETSDFVIQMRLTQVPGNSRILPAPSGSVYRERRKKGFVIKFSDLLPDGLLFFRLTSQGARLPSGNITVQGEQLVLKGIHLGMAVQETYIFPQPEPVGPADATPRQAPEMFSPEWFAEQKVGDPGIIQIGNDRYAFFEGAQKDVFALISSDTEGKLYLAVIGPSGNPAADRANEGLGDTIRQVLKRDGFFPLGHGVTVSESLAQGHIKRSFTASVSPTSVVLFNVHLYPLTQDNNIRGTRVQIEGDNLVVTHKQGGTTQTHRLALSSLAAISPTVPAPVPSAYPLYSKEWFDALPEDHSGVYFYTDPVTSTEHKCLFLQSPTLANASMATFIVLDDHDELILLIIHITDKEGETGVELFAEVMRTLGERRKKTLDYALVDKTRPMAKLPLKNGAQYGEADSISKQGVIVRLLIRNDNQLVVRLANPFGKRHTDHPLTIPNEETTAPQGDIPSAAEAEAFVKDVLADVAAPQQHLVFSREWFMQQKVGDPGVFRLGKNLFILFTCRIKKIDMALLAIVDTRTGKISLTEPIFMGAPSFAQVMQEIVAGFSTGGNLDHLDVIFGDEGGSGVVSIKSRDGVMLLHTFPYSERQIEIPRSTGAFGTVHGHLRFEKNQIVFSGSIHERRFAPIAFYPYSSRVLPGTQTGELSAEIRQTHPVFTPEWFDALPDSHPAVFYVIDKEGQKRKFVYLSIMNRPFGRDSNNMSALIGYDHRGVYAVAIVSARLGALLLQCAEKALAKKDKTMGYNERFFALFEETNPLPMPQHESDKVTPNPVALVGSPSSLEGSLLVKGDRLVFDARLGDRRIPHEFGVPSKNPFLKNPAPKPAMFSEDWFALQEVGDPGVVEIDGYRYIIYRSKNTSKGKITIFLTHDREGHLYYSPALAEDSTNPGVNKFLLTVETAFASTGVLTGVMESEVREKYKIDREWLRRNFQWRDQRYELILTPFSPGSNEVAVNEKKVVVTSGEALVHFDTDVPHKRLNFNRLQKRADTTQKQDLYTDERPSGILDLFGATGEDLEVVDEKEVIRSIMDRGMAAVKEAQDARNKIISGLKSIPLVIGREQATRREFRATEEPLPIFMTIVSKTADTHREWRLAPQGSTIKIRWGEIGDEIIYTVTGSKILITLTPMEPKDAPKGILKLKYGTTGGVVLELDPASEFFDWLVQGICGPALNIEGGPYPTTVDQAEQIATALTQAAAYFRVQLDEKRNPSWQSAELRQRRIAEGIVSMAEAMGAMGRDTRPTEFPSPSTGEGQGEGGPGITLPPTPSPQGRGNIPIDISDLLTDPSGGNVVLLSVVKRIDPDGKLLAVTIQDLEIYGDEIPSNIMTVSSEGGAVRELPLQATEFPFVLNVQRDVEGGVEEFKIVIDANGQLTIRDQKVIKFDDIAEPFIFSLKKVTHPRTGKVLILGGPAGPFELPIANTGSDWRIETRGEGARLVGMAHDTPVVVFPLTAISPVRGARRFLKESHFRIDPHVLNELLIWCTVLGKPIPFDPTHHDSVALITQKERRGAEVVHQVESASFQPYKKNPDGSDPVRTIHLSDAEYEILKAHLEGVPPAGARTDEIDPFAHLKAQPLSLPKAYSTEDLTISPRGVLLPTAKTMDWLHKTFYGRTEKNPLPFVHRQQLEHRLEFETAHGQIWSIPVRWIATRRVNNPFGINPEKRIEVYQKGEPRSRRVVDTDIRVVDMGGYWNIYGLIPVEEGPTSAERSRSIKAFNLKIVKARLELEDDKSGQKTLVESPVLFALVNTLDEAGLEEHEEEIRKAGRAALKEHAMAHFDNRELEKIKPLYFGKRELREKQGREIELVYVAESEKGDQVALLTGVRLIGSEKELRLDSVLELALGREVFRLRHRASKTEPDVIHLTEITDGKRTPRHFDWFVRSYAILERNGKKSRTVTDREFQLLLDRKGIPLNRKVLAGPRDSPRPVDGMLEAPAVRFEGDIPDLTKADEGFAIPQKVEILADAAKIRALLQRVPIHDEFFIPVESTSFAQTLVGGMEESLTFVGRKSGIIIQIQMKRGEDAPYSYYAYHESDSPLPIQDAVILIPDPEHPQENVYFNVSAQFHEKHLAGRYLDHVDLQFYGKNGGTSQKITDITLRRVNYNQTFSGKSLFGFHAVMEGSPSEKDETELSATLKTWAHILGINRGQRPDLYSQPRGDFDVGQTRSITLGGRYELGLEILRESERGYLLSGIEVIADGRLNQPVARFYYIDREDEKGALKSFLVYQEGPLFYLKDPSTKKQYYFVVSSEGEIWLWARHPNIRNFLQPPESVGYPMMKIEGGEYTAARLRKEAGRKDIESKATREIFTDVDPNWQAYEVTAVLGRGAQVSDEAVIFGKGDDGLIRVRFVVKVDPQGGLHFEPGRMREEDAPVAKTFLFGDSFTISHWEDIWNDGEGRIHRGHLRVVFHREKTVIERERAKRGGRPGEREPYTSELSPYGVLEFDSRFNLMGEWNDFKVARAHAHEAKGFRGRKTMPALEGKPEARGSLTRRAGVSINESRFAEFEGAIMALDNGAEIMAGLQSTEARGEDVPLLLGAMKLIGLAQAGEDGLIVYKEEDMVSFSAFAALRNPQVKREEIIYGKKEGQGFSPHRGPATYHPEGARSWREWAAMNGRRWTSHSPVRLVGDETLRAARIKLVATDETDQDHPTKKSHAKMGPPRGIPTAVSPAAQSIPIRLPVGVGR